MFFLSIHPTLSSCFMSMLRGETNIFHDVSSVKIEKHKIQRRSGRMKRKSSISTGTLDILWVYRCDFWVVGVFFQNHLEGSSDTWDVYVLSIRNTLGDSEKSRSRQNHAVWSGIRTIRTHNVRSELLNKTIHRSVLYCTVYLLYIYEC